MVSSITPPWMVLAAVLRRGYVTWFALVIIVPSARRFGMVKWINEKASGAHF
jgi:hypothetical protein